jgi:hypothetical protein
MVGYEAMRLRFLLAAAIATVAFGAAAGVAAAALSAPPGFTGGPYTVASGETVTVYSSDAYASDPAFNQGWADFLASMPHGPELSQLTLLVAPMTQVQSVCGWGALGCYSPQEEAIFTSGDDVTVNVTAKSIVAHEYGHHLEHNRSNPPFSSDDYGPKRWASLLSVCSGARNGTFFPGDEGVNYGLNPAEVFAEDYRTLVERTLGLTPTGWGVVDSRFIPNDAVLAAVQEDVTNPWTGPTTTSFSGRFTKGPVASRAFRITTPLDGTLQLTLRAPGRSVYDLRLLDASGTRLLGQSTVGSTARVKSVTYAVCGQRAFVVRVRRTSGSGAFRLTVSMP